MKTYLKNILTIATIILMLTAASGIIVGILKVLGIL